MKRIWSSDQCSHYCRFVDQGMVRGEVDIPVSVIHLNVLTRHPERANCGHYHV